MQTRLIPTLAGPGLGALIFAILVQLGLPLPAAATASLTAWCAVWWVLEPIPIPVTSLLPLALLPLFNILTVKDVAQAYGNPLILLMLGGAMLSKAMEASGAHRRMALGLINLFGGSSGLRVVFGFMVAAAVLSMWISNTATALMLLPVALAVLERADKPLAVPLLLAIAYGCSIGGLGTPIGTPPNIIFLKIYKDVTGESIGFMTWMLHTLPLVAVFLPLTAFWLCRNLGQTQAITMPASGPWRPHERRVLSIFALTAIAWITMEEPFGGWKTWLNMPQADYGSVALLAVVAMFLCPDGKGQRVITWEQARDIEWGVLLLFAGGIALAQAFMSSGLSQLLASQLTLLTQLPLPLTVLLVCLTVTFLTEVTSNTATATLLMPIMASAAVALNIEPALLMIPAALSASCAFMLPVATPPNAIVFASGKLHVKDMARAGLLLNIAGAVLISISVLVIYG